MEKVTGIGGFFFLGRDTDKLNEWYETHLGITRAGQEYNDGSCWQDEGPTFFGAESQQDQIGEPGYSWRINFRVRNLDAMIAQLRSAGIPVVVESTIYPNGRFAHLHDPNGNSIELWEPSGADLVRPTAQQQSNQA